MNRLKHFDFGDVAASRASSEQKVKCAEVSGRLDSLDRSLRRSFSAPALLAVGLLLQPKLGLGLEEAPASRVAVAGEAQEALTLRAQQWLQAALAPVRVSHLEPVTSGWSGARAYRVFTESTATFFAKVVHSWEDVEDPAELTAEFGHAAWAAAWGFGPKTVFADAKRGLFVTEFLSNEMGAWDQGGQEPRLSATLATMRALHTSEPVGALGTFDGRGQLASWQTELSKVASKHRHDANV